MQRLAKPRKSNILENAGYPQSTKIGTHENK